MGLKVARRAAWAVAALVALIVALLVLAHTPPAASRVQAWIVARIAAAWKLDLASSTLEYNLLTRRVALTDVRLSAPGHGDEPFFTARRVSASLPWAIFLRTVRLSSLVVDDGRVLLVREGGVLVNLPPPSGLPPPIAPRRLDIRGLTLRNLLVDYVDRTGGIDVHISNLQAALSERDVPGFLGAGGPLSADSVYVRVGGHETSSGAVKGELAFDGSTAALTAVTVPLRESTVVVDGRVNRVLDDAALDLTLKGTLDMAPLVEWAPPPVPVAGAGSFAGTMQGKLAAYEIRLAFQSPALRIARADPMPLDGDLSVTSARALVERFRVVAPGTPRAPGRPGTIEGQATYTFGAASRLDVAATFRDLDMDVALAAYDFEPTAFAAWEDGTATLTRPTPLAPLEIDASGRSSALPRRGRIAVTGTWSARVGADGQWSARHDHQMLDTVRVSGTAQWPSVEPPTPAPLAGPLAVAVGDVGRAVGAARGSGLDVAESLAAFSGPVTGDLALGGTLDEPRVEGRLESAQLGLPIGGSGPASADVVLSSVAIDVPRFELSAQGMRVAGEAGVQLESGQLSGSVTADVDSMPELARPFLGDTADPLTGTARLTASLGGTTEAPDIPWRLESTPIAHGEQPIGTLTADGRVIGTVVQVDRARIDQGIGGADGSGRYDYESETYTGLLSGKGLRVGQPFVGAIADALVVDVQFEGKGTVDAPGGGGFVRVVPEGGRIAELMGAAETRLQLANGRVETRTFVPKLRALVDAAVEMRAPYAYTGTAVATKLDVQPLALAAGAVDDQVSGTVDLSATFQGEAADGATATAFVNLQDVSVTAAGVPLRLDRPARLTVSPTDFTVDDLSLKVGAGLLTASGRLRDPILAPLAVWFGGPVGDLVTIARSFGVVADLEATGDLNAWWESTGGIDRASATATLRNGRVTWQQFPPVEGLQVDASYDGTTVVVSKLTATWQDGGIEGSARVPRAMLESRPAGATVTPGRVDMTLRGLTQHALRPWLSEDAVSKIDARVSATLALDVASADMQGITGTLILDEATVTAAGVPIAQHRPAYMSFTRGVLTFDDVAFSAGEPVFVGGSVTFGEATTLDVSITGTPGLRPFSVLSPQLSVDGVAKLGVYVSGTTDAPRFNGRIDLDGAEIVTRDPRIVASDVSGPILLEGNRIVLPGLKGTLNGGVLDASGDVQVSGIDVIVGNLTFQAQGVAVEYPRDVDTEIDALLVLVLGKATPLLRGDVVVQRGAYRGTVSLPALVAFNRSAVPVGEAQPLLDTVRLDISVSTEEDLVVDNNYGRFEAGADLRLQGTVAQPGVTGRADLREGGEVFVLGGSYRLNESSISFTNPTAIEPDLSVSMSTRQSGADLTLTLSGTLDRLQTSVTSSDPTATDQNVVNVLLGGNSLGRDDALALLSGELLGVGRAIGLDSLRLERDFDTDVMVQDPGLIAEDFDPSTRLTLSKRLRSDVEVILSQDLRSSRGLSAVFSYRPIRAVELRAASRDDTDRAYTVRHEISFGGGQPPTTTRREQPDVATVRFEGAGGNETALRDRLRLEPGDRFDFVRWRDDVDRLERWYDENGRLQARVRASRTTAADGRPELVYRITPGPQTTLTVDGTPVSSSLRQRLEEIWAGSIFDRFMLEEVQREVELDLVRRDIVGGSVTARVTETTPERKVVHVQVSGGQQARGRRLEFPGAEVMSTGTLEGVLRARGLLDHLWVDPNVTVEPLRTYYTAAGYRNAAITPELPRFDGDTAVLSVTVAEGPVTRVGAVSFEGVDGDSTLRQQVETAGRLPTGEPYREADVDTARRQVEAVFRRRGFNDVVVRPRAAIEGEQAAVAFAVTPGPEQRLADVVVSGTERTRPESVVRALGLKPGTPVDFQQWAQARKRVFDTNVFRQVEVRPEEVAGGQGTNGTEQVRARVTVSEWPTWRLRYGLQLNDRDQSDLGLPRTQDLGVVADAQNRNVLGRGFTFGLYGRVERRLYSTSSYVTFPTFFGRAVQTNVFASASRQDLELGDGDPELDLRRFRELVSIEQRIRRGGRTFETTYGYRLSRETLDGLDPEDPFYQAPLIGRFTSTGLFDHRDDPFDATKGWYSSLTAERVSNFDSGEDSIKVLGAAYYYRTLRKITVASALRIGGSFLGPLLTIDPFYVGGANTVRGYADRGLGPKTFTGLSTGGNAQLILNQEVRAPVYGWLKGVVFVDAGNVFASNGDLSLTNLEVGYGIGIRLDTPFSLLRLDFGLPAGGGAKRFYFGIGQVF